MRLILFIITSTLCLSSLSDINQGQQTQPSAPTQYAAGRSIPLHGNVTVKVLLGTTTPFAGYLEKGQPLVVDLHFTATSDAIVDLFPSRDATKSGLALLIGGERIAPYALSSTTRGSTDKVVLVDNLVTNPKTGRGVQLMMMFANADEFVVHYLFRLRDDQLNLPKALVLEISSGEMRPDAREEVRSLQISFEHK